MAATLTTHCYSGLDWTWSDPQQGTQLWGRLREHKGVVPSSLPAPVTPVALWTLGQLTRKLLHFLPAGAQEGTACLPGHCARARARVCVCV